MNLENRINNIIGSYLKGNCTVEEFERAREILKEPHSHLGLRGVLYEKWKELEPEDAELSEDEITDLRNTLSGIHHQINLSEGTWEVQSGMKRILTIITRVAAILLLPVMLSGLWYFYNSRKPYRG
jgi:hypothetical protein